MGFDEIYFMLFCGAPGRRRNFMTVDAATAFSWLGDPKMSRFDYREILA